MHKKAAFNIAVGMVLKELQDECGIDREKLSQSLETTSADITMIENGDERMTAYSFISGGLYFPCNSGATCDCTIDCPADPPEQGAFAFEYIQSGASLTSSTRQ